MNPYEIERLAGKHVSMSGDKAKRKVREIELAECKALYQWAKHTVIDGLNIADYLTHIPNEGKRGPKARKSTKGFHRNGRDIWLHGLRL